MRRSVICLVLFLNACASQPPAPSTSVPAPAAASAAPGSVAIPVGKAAVHIYRRAAPLGPAVLSIYDGSHPLGQLPVGTRIDYFADPGPRALKAVGQGVGVLPYATTFNAGQSYYFVVYFLGDQQKGDASLAPVDAAKAAAQMSSLISADTADTTAPP